MTTTIWGVSALNHDAAITVMSGNDILFAAHSERYSRIKNDPNLNHGIIDAALQFGIPDEIIWYEHPLLKKARQLYAGQYHELFSKSPKEHLLEFGISASTKYVGHHESHAAAGYFTSGFSNASILVCDAIGESDCISIWKAEGNKLECIWKQKYPHSLGLLYSAMTKRCGLKPNEEEYILMGMAAYGEPKYYDTIVSDFIKDVLPPYFTLKHNVHRGIDWWMPELQSEQDKYDIAASMQKVSELYVKSAVRWMRRNLPSSNLVMMGGVALNCVANEKIINESIFDNIWIMPNPGDAGSSLGAILAHTKQQANWQGPYLGTNIDREFDYTSALQALEEYKMIGIANGRAEFGPRAFGNRSLLADPRGPEVKDMVNDIKKRQRFRPFAPIVLEHLAKDYFDLPVAASPYMQITAACKYPELFPAICHVDGSSRVQTLNTEQNPTIYKLLTMFYENTGCPILLNTSLNIKGEPLVDSWDDAMQFNKYYNVRIF